jgi:tRNA (adenine22-N1)-methyltransferase
MNISKRLKAVVSMISEGNTVADIGTDHGYVPIYMVTERGCNFAYAMDVNEGPLKRAEENIIKYNVNDRIEIRLSDGIKKLKAGEADTIVIAGMGGILINRILGDGLEVAKASKELILSPHSDVNLVRRFLADNGFCISDEQMVFDENKYYFIIKAIPGEMVIDDDTYEWFGSFLLNRKDVVLYDYLNKEKAKRDTILSAISPENNATRYKEVLKELEIIQKGIDMYEG